VERNNCKEITVYEGDATLLPGKKYDVIIANINRNILLNDMQTYTACLSKGGLLFLSVLYEEDIPFIDESCQQNGLKFQSKHQQDNWICLQHENVGVRKSKI